METKLRTLRKQASLKLREIAAITGTNPGTVHDMEVRGILTPRAARKYAAAFPGKTWKDLMDEPPAYAGKQ